MLHNNKTLIKSTALKKKKTTKRCKNTLIKFTKNNQNFNTEENKNLLNVFFLLFIRL